MNLDLKNVMGQIGNIWNGISLSHKFIMIMMTMGFIGGIIGVTQWARKPDFALLYGELGPKESGEIVDLLKEDNVPFQIRGNGSAIAVPSEKVHEMRLKLAGKGLPREESGYELLDKVGFGTSDFVQRVNYRRAIQGELAKTIRHLDYVEWAQVHLALPEGSLFVEDEKSATASVILKLKSRSAGVLRPEQVASIVHLVSAGVEGLKPENVTITDTRGNLLSKKELPSSMIGASNDQLEMKKKIEDYFVAKAQDLLEKIVGGGKSVVRVSAELDFKHVDEKLVEFDPERRVPKVQTVTTRVSGGAPFSGGGVPGMQANLMSQSGIIQSVGSSENEETAQTQYELSKTERIIADHGASLKRLSVAVLVDGMYEDQKAEDGKIQKVYSPRNKDDMVRIAALVKQAIGIDESSNRNDTFEIQNVQFYEPSFEQEEASLKKEQQKEFMLKMAKNGSLAITVLVFLLFVMRSMKKLKKARATNEQHNFTNSHTSNMNMTTDEVDEEEEEKADDAKQFRLREQVVKNIRKDPSVTASSLKKWITADLKAINK
ncbi:MAG TPA: flagellar basal-body MS-ring/collar protein FliF [Candidatus Wunengus sp. YC63]|uniref:flagellar basal-body MS-ring/collar protein FliF n=1 Tax=unclassified Candidatus Wunengus TaxID=3367695 RepID=UPI004025D628